MIEIAPSILNSDLTNLGAEIHKIRKADWIHFDVMDGHFVPNLTFGPMFVKALQKISGPPIEAHLMVKNPEVFVPWYAESGSKRIIVHAEASHHLHQLVQHIKELGCQAGIALNPATSLETIEYLLAELDLVLIMTVNPGFGGQKLIPAMLDKIRKLHRKIEERQLACKIEVDGGVNWNNAAELIEAGVNVIVAGTLIYQDPDPEAAVARLKGIVS